MARDAILIIADRVQFPPAVFLAARLATLKGDRPVDIVLATGISDALTHAGWLQDRGITLLEIGQLHADIHLPTTYYFTRTTYYALFVPSLLKKYRRVLYLDTDTYPESERVFDLFSLDMAKYPVAAVRDVHVAFLPTANNLTELRMTLGPPNGQPGRPAKYLNSGVLLIDMAAWRAKSIERKVLAALRGPRPWLQWHDQSLLNSVLRGNWQELSPSFNMVTRAWNSFVRRFVPPVVLHFTGPVKPWHRAFIDDHPVRTELAAFLASSPWATFVADANPPPLLLNARTPPPAPEVQKPLWRDFVLDAFVSYLATTDFADVRQGITVVDPTALPATA